MTTTGRDEEEKVEESEEVVGAAASSGVMAATATTIGNGSFDGGKETVYDEDTTTKDNSASYNEVAGDGEQQDVENGGGDGGAADDDDDDNAPADKEEDDKKKKKRRHMIVPADAPWPTRMWEGTLFSSRRVVKSAFVGSLTHCRVTPAHTLILLVLPYDRCCITNSLHYVLATGFDRVRWTAGSRCHIARSSRRTTRLARRGTVYRTVRDRTRVARTDVDAARYFDGAQSGWTARWTPSLHVVEFARSDRVDRLRYAHHDLRRPEQHSVSSDFPQRPFGTFARPLCTPD